MQTHRSLLFVALFLLLSTLLFASPPQTFPAVPLAGNGTRGADNLSPTETRPMQTVWPQTIVAVEETSPAAALDRLEAGELDVYASPTADRAIVQRIADSPNLDGYPSWTSYNELTLNPAGPVFSGTGKLNPFAVPRVREALNRLVDRDYIVEQVYGGLARPRWFPISSVGADYTRLDDVARSLELQYNYDREQARQTIAQEMTALGATLVGGRWYYEGEPVVIIFLIRIEDERRLVGDYVADQLESIGFTVDRQYKTSSQASPIWFRGDPNAGLWHIYTGGWVTTMINRNEEDNFDFFYTPRGIPSSPLWQAYRPTPEFDALAGQLASGNYATLAERRAMMAQALEWALEDSVRIWLVDHTAITPRRSEVAYASDLAVDLYGSHLWPYTLRRVGNAGGSPTMTLAMPSLMSDPWNPLNGTYWIYDRGLIYATGDPATMPDPFTGLAWPQRIERAELVVAQGRAVTVTHDWIDLQFVPEIQVPADAWVDWDASAQRFLTAGEVYSQTRTALRKSVVYYPADLTATVTWHDGSPFSVADVVLNMILTFDRAKPESAVYDESLVPAFNAFMSSFKGVRIVSTQPLVIETYSDAVYNLDGELLVDAWWPFYNTGPGAWHNLALGLRAEAAGQGAFTQDKANNLGIEWLNYIDGPSLAILEGQLDQALATSYIPYSPTLGLYITTAQADERWQHLAQWYATYGHFWIGTGPFYLEQAQPTTGTLTLRRYPGHPDAVDRWAAFAAPPIPEVAIDGPTDVLSGTAAAFDVWATFEGQPYAVADVEAVHYQVIDAAGHLALTGDAQALEDGHWQIVLDEAQTGQLPAGPTRLEVSVVPRRIVVPGRSTHEFSISVHIAVAPGVGGTLVYTDAHGTVTAIEVPPDGVTQTVTLAYAPLPAILPPTGFGFGGLAFALNAYLSDTLQPGFRFATPVTISIVYQDEQIIGLDEGTLVLFYEDENTGIWTDAAETCDPASSYVRVPEENRLALPICHLSRFALLGPVEQVFLPLVWR